MGHASIIAKLTEKLGCAPTEAQIQNYKTKKAAKKAADALAAEATAAEPPAPAAPAAKPSKNERKKAAAAAAAAITTTAGSSSSSAAAPPPAKKQKTAAAAAPSAAATNPSPVASGAKRAPSPYNLYMKVELPRLRVAEPSLTHTEAFTKCAESWQTSEQNPKNGGTALAEQAKAAKAAFDAAKATPGAADAAPMKRKRVSAVSTNAAATSTAYSQLCCDALVRVLRATAAQTDETAIVDALRATLAADAPAFEVCARSTVSRPAARIAACIAACIAARIAASTARALHARACTQVAYAKAHGLKPPKLPRLPKAPKQKMPKEPKGQKVNQEVLAKALKLMRRYNWDIFDAMAGGMVCHLPPSPAISRHLPPSPAISLLP